MQLVKNHGHIVKPTRCLAESIDPDDNKLIECADAARADYLITGNLKHFPLKWKKTRVVSAREFLDLVAPRFKS
jgi:predicted nucleic acid-binding protein